MIAPMVGGRVERTEHAAHPDNTEPHGDHGWGQGDEAAVGDPENDGEEDQQAVARIGDDPKQHTERQHEERELVQPGDADAGGGRTEAEPACDRTHADQPQQDRGRTGAADRVDVVGEEDEGSEQGDRDQDRRDVQNPEVHAATNCLSDRHGRRR